jgi:hypothetical protein
MTGKCITLACERDYGSSRVLITNLWIRFVGRDMFIRYTHFGVGHPALLRRITRDCFGYESGLGDTMEDIYGTVTRPV